MAIDDGAAVHYTALQTGIPVYGSDEVEIGRLREVLDNYREHIFDGLVIDTGGGDLRFVDAPEVARTAERGVTLTISSGEATDLPPPEKGPAVFRPRGGGKLSRLLGGGWRKS
ncbi:MAG: hypothetical protein H0V50_08470 [Thermoleophilaceae bacterium]|nr:hypothetical protein [Thermoleophilaceae bacterium]